MCIFTANKLQHMQYSFKGSLGRISSQVSRDLGRYLEEKFREAGCPVNNHEWAVLSYLTEHPRSCQKDIAHFLGTDKVMVKRIIDDMEHDGYLVREEDAHDKRFNQITLTAQGAQLFNELKSYAAEVLTDVYRDIPEVSIYQCLDTLRQISDNLYEILRR